MPLTEVSQFTVSHLQVLDEEGRIDERLDPKCSEQQLLELYEAMVLSREVDQRMLKLQRQGRMGTFPLSTGQEAVACGAALAMSENDWLVGSYRELGARLMRGDSLLQYMRYWNGYEEGNVHPERPRSLPIAAVVGSQPLHAVGIAYASAYQAEADNKEPDAVVTFFGDGATSEGDIHEAFNFAGVWQAPVVFICANNQWAISTGRESQTRSETIAQKAIAYGFEGIQVDGNDGLAVYKATAAALQRAKSGGGPTLIEALTYRLMMHTTADDPKRYRGEDEVDSWWKRDPLTRFERYLRGRGLWDDERDGDLRRRTKARIDQTISELEADYLVAPDAPFDHVFASKHSYLEAQRQRFLERQRRRELAAALKSVKGANG